MNFKKNGWVVSEWISEGHKQDLMSNEFTRFETLVCRINSKVLYKKTWGVK